ncbi:LysR family transcriptional regulator [Marinobacterium jannaschii]|uniref:LysR family transcriptional regulator n=1 Tax=Marinobacterium jannaschii TaxID=64970 RepID=UPI000487C314|nr:LysR family transcriptional regulator [Marinobacterium jannaschii]
MNQLRQMSLFARVVEAGSISAAAGQLELSKSVVSQHLKNLEAELGVMLLKRTTRRQHLTAAGEQFYQRCRELNRIAEEAWTEVQSQHKTVGGPIRLTAPDALMTSLIAPLVGQLVTQHPALRPELIASDAHLDLMQQQIDLAIRVGSSASSQLRQRRIGQFRDVLCVAPQLQERGAEALPYVANTWQGTRIEHRLVNAEGEEHCLSYRPSSRANSLQLCRTLLESGAGVGILPDFIFQQSLQQGLLVELLPGFQLSPVPVYALHTFAGNPPLSVELLIEQISQRLN